MGTVVATLRRYALFPLVGLVAACGADSESDRTLPLTVEVRIEVAGGLKACAEVPEIEGLEVALYSAGTNTVRPGYPRPADCGSGSVTVQAGSGDYVLEVRALGVVDGTPGGTLYGARTPITLPRTEPLSLALKPEVAFLTLEWSYGETSEDPCAAGVASVLARVGSYEQTLPCQAAPTRLTPAFGLRSYVIELSALSSEGVPLYLHRTERQLQRGENQYSATLSPRGHRLFLDWDFIVAGAKIRACNDPAVRVDEVTIKVGDEQGGAPLEERVPCAAPRPYALRSSRFFSGRQLVLELSADGEATFSGGARFTMPDEDFQADAVNLVARGEVTVGVQVRTATCADPTARYDLTVRSADRAGAVVAEATLNTVDEEAHLMGLPYGRYQVEVQQQGLTSPGCRTQDLRTVDAKVVVWEDLRL